MNTRITEAFAKAKAEGRGAFVAYLTMGYPSIAASEQAVDDIIAAMDASGHLIEVKKK